MSNIGMGAPYEYDYINAQTQAVRPSTMHLRDNGMQRFFRKYLLEKAFSVFEWRLPETWSRNYFLYVLYCWGYVAVINTDKFGVIPQGCGLQGYNVMYDPTTAVISNPLLTGILTPTIGQQCELIKLQPNYSGILDIVDFYADMLALSAATATTNLFNSKLAYVFAAKNKTGAESFKKMYDELASGNPAVVLDKNLFDDDGKPNWTIFNQNVAQTYIAGTILDDMRKWECRFDTEIGIPNSNTEKRERLITDEVQSNNVEVKSKAALWLETLQECVKKVNAMFGTDISVDWRFKEQSASQRVTEGGDMDE